MQLSGPALKSLASFYIELEQFTVHFQRKKPVYGTSGLTINLWGLKRFSKLHSWPKDPIVLCVDHNLARILYQEQYFHACTL